MIADYMFGCHLCRESFNSLLISVQKLCSTHKLCICPMNCKLFLNVVICANFATVSSYFCICRSTISAFVLFGEAQANDICHNMQLNKYMVSIITLDCCFNSRLREVCLITEGVCPHKKVTKLWTFSVAPLGKPTRTIFLVFFYKAYKRGGGAFPFIKI